MISASKSLSAKGSCVGDENLAAQLRFIGVTGKLAFRLSNILAAVREWSSFGGKR
jgi:hypothetical protein